MHRTLLIGYIANPFFPVTFFFSNADQDEIDMIDNGKKKEDMEGFEDEIEIPQCKGMTNNLDASRLLEQNASLMVELDSKDGEGMPVAVLVCPPRRNASGTITLERCSNNLMACLPPVHTQRVFRLPWRLRGS